MKTRTWKRFRIFILTLLTYINIYGNNLSVSNIFITDVDTTLKTAGIQFDISWENSWRTSTLENNWDASWIFVKYRISPGGVWKHATLLVSGYTTPAGAAINVTSDGKGAFIYRALIGGGSNNWAGAKLKWNYGTDGVMNTTSVDVCVYGIEMVYIPQGSFYLGDGTTSTIWGQFEAGTSGSPFLVTSESGITLGGGSAGSLGNNNATGMSSADDWNDISTKSLPGSFPKGFSAFYIMKYELTQIQYVDFLNKLDYAQQTSRTANSPSSPVGTPAMSNTYRNGIDIMVPGVNPTTPAIYACNLNGNGMFNEAADGLNISCNFIGWNDLSAYLDWSGLRPITEFEYEKASRGTLNPIANEYAWGDILLNCGTSVTNSGQVGEIAATVASKCNCNNSLGVMRTGCFAKSSSTTRTSTGASYYGVLDLSGNLWEATITVGNAIGRSFNGTHGDGFLTSTGNSNVVSWPGTNGNGVGYRGGAFTVTGNFLRLSSRVYQNYSSNTRDIDFMCRGARTP